MQSLLCKALQTYVSERFGSVAWEAALKRGGLQSETFDLFQGHDRKTIGRLFGAVAFELRQSPKSLLEDLGTWVCTQTKLEPIRRLIRFSGETYEDMLYSLEEMYDRIKMAMPDVEVPRHKIEDLGRGEVRIRSYSAMPGAGAFLIGILRAMADDYGTLALVDFVDHWKEGDTHVAEISVQLLDVAFAEPRAFDLGGAA